MSGETIDIKYLKLIERLCNEGTHFDGRNGGTQAIIDRPLFIDWDLNTDAFPILAIRKQNFLHYVNEFLWEINGGTNIKELNNVYAPVDSRFLWKPWAGIEDGYIPYSYGASWRRNGEMAPGNISVDQLKMLEYMIKENPMSRRLTLITQDVFKNAIINDPSSEILKDYPPQVPPCHPASYFTSDGTYLNFHVTSRSQDIICGLPGDMIRYHLMTVCFAKLANLIPGKIWFSFTNLHYYKEHEEKLIDVVERYIPDISNYPKMLLDKRTNNHVSLDEFSYVDFHLEGYYPEKFESFPIIV